MPAEAATIATIPNTVLAAPVPAVALPREHEAPTGEQTNLLRFFKTNGPGERALQIARDAEVERERIVDVGRINHEARIRTKALARKRELARLRQEKARAIKVAAEVASGIRDVDGGKVRHSSNRRPDFANKST